MSARFVHHSLDHYLEELEALAEAHFRIGIAARQ
jgi:hypothetical protein